MLLSETSINISNPNISVYKSSDGFGWPNLNVSIIDSKPYEAEITHGGGSNLWMSMAMAPLDMSITTGRKEFPLSLPTDQICIHAPRAVLGTIRKNDARLLHVSLRRELISEVLGELYDYDADNLEIESKFGIDDPGMTETIRMLGRSLFEPAGNSALKVEYLSRALAVDVFTKHIASSRPESALEPHKRGLTVPQIRRVINYIHENLSAEIMLNDLANVAGMSRTLFIQCFKASFSETPYQYIIHARIRRSQSMLAGSRTPLVEIALLCGFADQAHFCRSFQKSTGMTPTRYRRETQ
ncbi:MAG: AraC family transcriptional regulator [Methylobacillus sp.]|jgi:AraC family transcriptional regulator|nr:AraC family transcriptional regulator [Methylobacillus sp.]